MNTRNQTALMQSVSPKGCADTLRRSVIRTFCYSSLQLSVKTANPYLPTMPLVVFEFPRLIYARRMMDG